MNINELKKERKELETKANDILALDEQTDDQVDQVIDLQAKIKDLNGQIGKAEKREQLEALKIAASNAGEPVSESEEKEMNKISREYSFTKALGSLKNKKSLEGVEAELHQEATRENPNIEGNLAIPDKFIRIKRKEDYETRDLTIATEGGDVRPLDLRGPIPILAPDPIVARMGATVIQGLKGNLQFSRHNGAATMAWEGETDANAETTPTLDNISLSPNRLGGYTDVSTQFLIQASFDGENFVRNELNRAFAEALDTAAINGSGSGNQPTGLLNQSIGASDVGTNGGAPTWGIIKGNYENVESANARADNMAALTHPSIKYQLMEKPKQASGVEGNFIISPNSTQNINVLGFPVFSSTLVPSNLSKGTGTNLSAYIVGDWQELIIAQWGGIDLLVDPYTQATSGLVRIVINGFFDVNVMHAASFSASDDIDPTA